MKTFFPALLQVLCFFLAPLHASIAQNSQIKFGIPLMAELEMRTFEKDTSAHAVILYDKGVLNGATMDFFRHVRIKILRHGGTSYGNFTVRVPSKSMIKGYTFNLENGQVITTELDKSNIYEEEVVDNFLLYKIFFPNVKPGAVVDLKYEFKGIPLVWTFQERIPVVYSELTLGRSQYIQFKKTRFGFGSIESIGDHKWVARDMPAIVEEPYMGHYSNYITHFKFDIERLTIPGRPFREFSTTWEKVGARLMESVYFGGVLRESSFLNEKAEEIKNSSMSRPEKVLEALRYVQSNIKFNGIYSVFASVGYREHFRKDHAGNSADVNLLLLSLLKKAGLNCYPIVMSTRDNGLINPGSASINSINHVAVYVRDGEIEIIVDATSPYSIPGVLPAECRNLSGYVVDLPAGWWVDLTTGKINSRKQFMNIKRTDDGEFTAQMSTTYEDYDFLNWIEDFDDHGSAEEYRQSLMAKSADLDIKDYQVTVDKEKLKAVEKKLLGLNGSGIIRDLGSEIIVYPFALTDTYNPFQSEKRNFPIDFVYPKSRSVVVVFEIPANYSLRNIPESVVLTPESGGAKFLYRCAVMNNLLTIKYDLVMEKQVYLENEYLTLRNFFINVNDKVSQPIRLDKKT